MTQGRLFEFNFHHSSAPAAPAADGGCHSSIPAGPRPGRALPNVSRRHLRRRVPAGAEPVGIIHWHILVPRSQASRGLHQERPQEASRRRDGRSTASRDAAAESSHGAAPRAASPHIASPHHTCHVPTSGRRRAPLRVEGADTAMRRAGGDGPGSTQAGAGPALKMGDPRKVAQSLPHISNLTFKTGAFAALRPVSEDGTRRLRGAVPT